MFSDTEDVVSTSFAKMVCDRLSDIEEHMQCLREVAQLNELCKIGCTLNTRLLGLPHIPIRVTDEFVKSPSNASDNTHENGFFRAVTIDLVGTCGKSCKQDQVSMFIKAFPAISPEIIQRWKDDPDFSPRCHDIGINTGSYLSDESASRILHEALNRELFDAVHYINPMGFCLKSKEGISPLSLVSYVKEAYKLCKTLGHVHECIALDVTSVRWKAVELHQLAELWQYGDVDNTNVTTSLADVPKQLASYCKSHPMLSTEMESIDKMLDEFDT